VPEVTGAEEVVDAVLVVVVPDVDDVYREDVVEDDGVSVIVAAVPDEVVLESVMLSDRQSLIVIQIWKGNPLSSC
jgi:hypothetical protein